MEENVIDFPCPSDVEVALEVLFQDFPGLDVPGFPCCALQSQVQALVKDNSKVEPELRHLISCNAIRSFHVVVDGTVDSVIVREKDFRKYVLGFLATTQDEVEAKAIQYFVEKVLQVCRDKFLEEWMLEQHFGTEATAFISHWIRLGVFVRRDTKSYWLSLPLVGRLLKHCRQGRREILLMLKRSRYHEIAANTLEKRKLKRSSFPAKFHLRELIGSGQVESIESPAGTILRLSA
ncbi:hypothetical protein GAYE_SCF34G4976 [Galdieria yellowstonensis]|uniref:Uncharacterized protein n=1 Tax=Galdieria yellowstonensis TaxID=3028027 RepID=A0AAV9IHX7_9RHOD|nr:hypothetical protein GAYE_SCF34G4976 [Galdieria yellowstonensis]